MSEIKRVTNCRQCGMNAQAIMDDIANGSTTPCLCAHNFDGSLNKECLRGVMFHLARNDWPNKEY